MSPEYFAKEMEKLLDENDIERGHLDADILLVQLIREHLPQFAEGVRHYEALGKWYA